MITFSPSWVRTSSVNAARQELVEAEVVAEVLARAGRQLEAQAERVGVGLGVAQLEQLGQRGGRDLDDRLAGRGAVGRAVRAEAGEGTHRGPRLPATPACANLSPRDRRQPQSHPLRLLRQPRHRHRQVRRLPDHRRRRACSPRPSTRSPTPATRRCCCSAASGRARPPTASTRSATAASATSGRSSSPSCCSRWAACSPSTRASRSSATRTRSRTSASPSASSSFAIVLESFSLRTAYREASHHKGADTTWWHVAAPLEAARAAGRAARGHRRRDRPVLRPRAACSSPTSPTSPAGTPSARSPSASCSSSSPSCWPSR